MLPAFGLDKNSGSQYMNNVYIIVFANYFNPAVGPKGGGDIP